MEQYSYYPSPESADSRPLYGGYPSPYGYSDDPSDFGSYPTNMNYQYGMGIGNYPFSIDYRANPYNYNYAAYPYLSYDADTSDLRRPFFHGGFHGGFPFGIGFGFGSPGFFPFFFI